MNELKLEDFLNIDIGKGKVIQENDTSSKEESGHQSNNINDKRYTIFCAVWHGDIKLKILKFYDNYRIILTKDDTFLESHVFRNSVGVVERTASLAKQIITGAYDKKETDRERVQKIIRQRGLTSYMNNTKWNKLLYALENEVPFVPPYEFKTLFESKEEWNFSKWKNWEQWEINYPGSFDDEFFPLDKMYVIEWIVLFPRICKNIGGLLVNIPKTTDETGEIQAVLSKYHIPYEMKGGYFVVYGYR